MDIHSNREILNHFPNYMDAFKPHLGMDLHKAVAQAVTDNKSLDFMANNKDQFRLSIDQASAMKLPAPAGATKMLPKLSTYWCAESALAYN